MSNVKSQISNVIALLIGVLASLLTVGIVAAQGGKVTDDQVNAVAKRLNCPVCRWTCARRKRVYSGET
jgi:hypothetical protein